MVGQGHVAPVAGPAEVLKECHSMRTRLAHKVKRGFTLIEILIVVVILGILAAIVIPQFTEASQDAEESAAKSSLQTVRAQVQLYNFKENGYPATLDALVTDGYLASLPDLPGDYQWEYDATSGSLGIQNEDW